MAIKILIDSASDISLTEAQNMGVELISMLVTFGEEEYLDGVNLLPEQFYEKLISGNVLPKTSQISPFRFEEKFEEMTKNGDEVIAIVLSSKLSGTYTSAVQASEKFTDKVFVVDSLSACVGERLLVEYALQLIKEGKTASQVFEMLEQKKQKLQIYAIIDTLKYLKLGGRISGASAVVGNLMSIKPTVGIIDGEVKMIAKSIGLKKAIDNLNKIILEKSVDFDMPYSNLWSGNDMENLNKYQSLSTHVWQTVDIPKHMMGGTIGTHIGPGAVGVAFFRK